MVALCGWDLTTGDTPKRKISGKRLYAEKYEAKSKSYLQEVAELR